MHFFYLHGFASSPRSGKARYFREQLAARGLKLEAPDFTIPDFEGLTITRMLAQLDAEIARQLPGPVALIGSSLGGLVACLAAERRRDTAGQSHPVVRLVLLAPALDFASDRRFDPVVEEWRRAGRRQVFHYGDGRPMQIGYALYEDARQYHCHGLNLDVPVLISQGRHDEVVLPATAAAFAAVRPNVRVRVLDDDHQLQAHLPEIWEESAAFLGLGEA